MTLELRKFHKNDIKTLFSWFQSERDVLQWAGAGVSWPLERGEFIELIKSHRGADPPREIWAVYERDRMLGHFQLTFNRRLATVGLGKIALDPVARARGRSGELMALILPQAFSRDWVHRVELLVYSHNTAAIRAYTTAGFVHEGTRRESTPIGEEIWDTHIMSILRKEFDKRTERE
ncbi:MAG: GNAT family protein [Pseudomonadota bacterium]